MHYLQEFRQTGVIVAHSPQQVVLRTTVIVASTVVRVRAEASVSFARGCANALVAMLRGCGRALRGFIKRLPKILLWTTVFVIIFLIIANWAGREISRAGR